MANVYEFMSGFLSLWDMISNEEIEDEVLLDVFENMTDDFKVKMENCCKYLKNLDANIDGLKAEENRIKAKRQALENAKDRLKGLMFKAQKACGEKKLQCGTFTTSIQSTGENVVMDEQYIENIPTEYLKFPSPVVDKTKIKEVLKSGVELDGIAHLEKTEYIKIS